MLFNSIDFLVFLGAVIALHGLCAAYGVMAQKGLLVAASLVFYGWFKADYVLLILLSIIFNFTLGQQINRRARTGEASGTLLALGVTANLALLGYYKYAAFFLGSLNDVFALSLEVPAILLPIAISFFTFQQIAFLVDASRGEAANYRLLDYMLFVTFFPQLIAGPIVHHKEMMPQFARRPSKSRSLSDLTVGLTIFAMGLFKKVVIADNLAPYADVVFGSAESGMAPGFFRAWIAALAYALQIYFDFSGYSDMAIGLARIFGIRLPVNFFSPYKATSIIDFWRRWHITLSRFLRDYLYIPLGGSRRSEARRYANLLLTMVIGGLWHGASWTFVAWGALHGFFLIVNHAWRALGAKLGWSERSSLAGKVIGTAVTFFVVVVAWVPFRAESFDGAWLILQSMAGQSGLEAGTPVALRPARIEEVLVLGAGLIIAWFLPNSLQIMARSGPALDPSGATERLPVSARSGGWALRWRPRVAWAGVLALANLMTIYFFFENQDSPFLYFQF